MKEIGLFEAKTNLSKIAARVRRTGQAVTLTKHGEPYVDLVPHHEEPVQRRSHSEVIAELDELSRTFPKCSYAQIKADIGEGRH